MVPRGAHGSGPELRRPQKGQRCYQLDFGEHDGERVRLGSVDGVAFRSEEHAQRVLDRVRALLADGVPLRQALARFRPAGSGSINAHLDEYLEHFRALVAAGRRSPTTLREIERYLAADGHLGAYWRGRPLDVRAADVEDFATWLGRRKISPKTQRNVLHVFRAILRRLHRREVIERVPPFPVIEVPEYAPRIIGIDDQRRILEAIPWERRGLFLAAATEALRLGELRALGLSDYDPATRTLRVTKAIKGPRLNAPLGTTKARTSTTRVVWSDELAAWLEWRIAQATSAARLRGEALLWCPTARNAAKRWTPDPVEKEWRAACIAAGVEPVGFQEGTRHATLTALGAVLPERMLRAFSRHRDARSLDHYTKPRPAPAAIVAALRPSNSRQTPD